MSSDSDKAALATLDSLENRLRKVEWYMSGSDNAAGPLQQVASQGKDSTVQARLARLENNMQNLSTTSPDIDKLVKLRQSSSSFLAASTDKHDLDARYPNLFHLSTSDISTTLSAVELFSIIGSCASSYYTTASRLHAVKDLPIAPAESSAALIALQPRLAQIELLQDSQAREISDLRARSAQAIQRWYEVGILGGSECWSEWEERTVDVEKRVRREEGLKAKELKEMGAYRP